MKLIIQIPCLNEKDTIAETLKDLPRSIEGIDSIEILIIDDGSNDGTSKVALCNGAHHIITHNHNRGLASAFSSGLSECLSLGADIIVNTDADNQYKAEYIHKLVRPIINGECDMVIGVRNIELIQEFSFLKKILQRLGSWVVRKVSGTSVEDVTSGFRVYSREAALKLNKFNEYTYTLDTIIQAGNKNISIKTVPIETNPSNRPSRLFKSTSSYVLKSTVAIIRLFVIYRPLKVFSYLGLSSLMLGILLGIRYLLIIMMGDGGGNVQSLILASILITTGVFSIIIGFIADLLSANRKLIEDLMYKINKISNKD
jgi:glycosyltransferase involved in cell wall biosynthesis